MATVERRRGRTGTILGIVMIVGGVVVGAISAVLFVLPFVTTFTQPTLAVPGVHHVDLDAATYNVYQRTEEVTDFQVDVTPQSRTRRPTIGPQTVSVVGPDGSAVLARTPGSIDEEMQRGSDTYVAVARIDVRESGEHEVTIADVPSSRIVIAKSFGDTFREAARWLLIGLLAGIAVVGGIVVLVVGWWTRRRDARAAMQPAAAPGSWSPHGQGPTFGTPAQPAPGTAPPGWYPDPHHPDAYRYWNGHAWTADTHEPGESD